MQTNGTSETKRKAPSNSEDCGVALSKGEQVDNRFKPFGITLCSKCEEQYWELELETDAEWDDSGID